MNTQVWTAVLALLMQSVIAEKITCPRIMFYYSELLDNWKRENGGVSNFTFADALPKNVCYRHDGKHPTELIEIEDCDL